MALATVVLGSLAFLVFWVTAMFPKIYGFPVSKTAGSLIGATLMVVFKVDSPDQAYKSINLPILGLLFGSMVVSIYLQGADMFRYLESALSYRCRGSKDLLCRFSFLVAIASALLTNDTCCVLFTELILRYCTDEGLPPEPFLLALTTSANIGSSPTPFGNPQNLLIARIGRISFGKFILGILPAMLVGVTLNLALLLAMYWNELSNVRSINARSVEMQNQLDNMMSMNALFDDENQTHGSYHSNEDHANEHVHGNGNLDDSTQRTHQDRHDEEMTSSEENPRFWKPCVYLVILGMLVALLAGLDPSWCTITAAIVLIVLHFRVAERTLSKVDYSLLVFFSGMFIAVDGFNRTKLPTMFWYAVAPHARINHLSGIAVLSTVIILLSNVASNVPTVLLLGPEVAASSAGLPGVTETKAWLILAWVSTVAGNLTLVGSVANLIVCEKARTAPKGQDFFSKNLLGWLIDEFVALIVM